jgi:hypothetical protein
MLLEHRLALELMRCGGRVRSILPFFVGDLHEGEYVKCNVWPTNAPDVVVDAVEQKLQGHLQCPRKVSPTATGMTVTEVMQNLRNFQGTFLLGQETTALRNAVDKSAKKARELVV